MPLTRKAIVGIAVALTCVLASFSANSNEKAPAHLKQESSAVPRIWDDAEMASLEVPLANPIGSPRQVPSSFYYKIPVRPIYKSYPVYAPGHEPPRYIEWLKQQAPEILWDDKDHAPLLKTKSDW